MLDNISEPSTRFNKHLGNKLRMSRLRQNKTLKEMSEMLGVSYQQIQKYEKGLNTISSPKLFDFARKLSVPIQYFFCDDQDSNVGMQQINNDNVSAKSSILRSCIHDNELVTLVKYYSKLKSYKARKRIIELLKAM